MRIILLLSLTLFISCEEQRQPVPQNTIPENYPFDQENKYNAQRTVLTLLNKNENINIDTN
ncbi:MAG TPA: hypothetical protein VNX68_02135, partial [Nitrosopumilaceae archaeon]|nr:hypothetical protein [Nitrosopumilaceae archaeon]